MQPMYCQSKRLWRQPLFTLLFVELLSIYFFSKSFLLPFNQCLGAQHLIFGKGIVAKASFCQIILHIHHFARFPILIFKINFAISTFGNFLRNVHLKRFHFKDRSHPTESLPTAIIFDKPSKTILNFFSCRKVSNILPMQNLHNTFLLIFFISNFIRDETYVYYYLHIVHLLGDLTCYRYQASTFLLLLAHLSVCALPWM